MDFLMARLMEPSTWAGLATLAQVVVGMFPAAAPYAHTVTVLAGAMAMGLAEKGMTK